MGNKIIVVCPKCRHRERELLHATEYSRIDYSDFAYHIVFDENGNMTKLLKDDEFEWKCLHCGKIYKTNILKDEEEK